MASKDVKTHNFSFENPLENVGEGKKNIVYSDIYNISFAKLETLHPFDSKKWGKIIKILIEAGFLKQEEIIEPVEATEEYLLKVHDTAYIKSLKSNKNVARIAEIWALVLLPNPVVQSKFLKPMRYQVTGTLMATCLAVEKGWGINVGGGFHHCWATAGGGFCPYADITLAIRSVKDIYPDRVKKVMIIDLDAHQGNGHARDFLDDDWVFIMDAYNDGIYPMDFQARAKIGCEITLSFFIEDEEYLHKVKRGLLTSLAQFSNCDLVLYNAGTDIMVGDQLGRLSITPEGIIQRDQLVFELCSAAKVPVVMVTSGGYQKTNARVIADSILNLKSRGFLH